MATDTKKAVAIRVDKERKAVIKEIDSKILIWERRATQSFVDRAYRISDDEKSDSEGSPTARSPRSPRTGSTSSASPLARASTVKSIARQIESTHSTEKSVAPITPRSAARNLVNTDLKDAETKTHSGASSNNSSPDASKKRLDSEPKSPNNNTTGEKKQITADDRRDSEQINTSSSSSSTDVENNNNLPKPNLTPQSSNLSVPVSSSLPTTPDVDRRRGTEGERLKYQTRVNHHEDCMAIERELRRLHNFSQIQNDKLKEKIGVLNAAAREDKKRVLLLEDELSFVYSKLKEMGVEIPVYTPPADLQIPEEPSVSETSPIKNRLKRIGSTEDVSTEDSNTEGESGKGEIKIKKKKKEKVRTWRKKKKGKDSDPSDENSLEGEETMKESKSFLSKFTSALSRSRAHSVSDSKSKRKGELGSDDSDNGRRSPSRTRAADAVNSPKGMTRNASVSDPPKPEEPDFAVAYGVTRGACKPPCKCLKYNTKSHGAVCACGHTSVTHLDLGKVAGYTGPADPAVVSDTKADRKGSMSIPTSNTASTDTSASDPSSPNGRPSQNGEGAPMYVLSDAQDLEGTTPKFTSDTKKNIRDTLKPEWLMEYDDLYFVEVLGKGTSSVVYKGTYKDEEVAIKVLRLETQKRDLEDFKKELEVLSFLKSEHVVDFVGAALEPKLCMVLEYCPRGSLYQYMHDVRLKFTWELLLKWITETIKGVNSLHLWKPQIVHRDLKTPNLLIDKDNKIKVCDFGLSRIIADDQNLTTLGKLRGTYAYTAPELYHGATFTTKSDVYSIGIVLWEMVNRLLTGKHDRPFAEYKEIQHDFQVIVKAATKKLRPTIPATCPEPIANLIKFCWHERQEDRPSCADLLVILEKLTNDYNASREAWDSVVPEVVPQPRFKREPSMKQGSPAIASPKGHVVRLSASLSSTTDSHTISSPNGTGHQRGASTGATSTRSAVQSNRDSPRKSDPGESSDQSQTSTEVKS